MHSRILQHIAFVVVMALAIPVTAQSKKPEPETFTGKVSSIQMKGRIATIKVDTESGDTLTVIVTPKVAFTVTARAEADLLKKLGKEPVMISAERTVWNEATKVYVAATLTVYHKVKVQQRRTEMNGGVDFCAPLISATDKEVVLGGGINKVVPEGATFALNVVSNDASLVTEGAQAELEGIKKGEKFLASRLAITLDKELTAEEVSMKKGPKAKPTAKSADKTDDKPAEKGTDKPAEKGDGKPLAASDPFKDVKNVQDDKSKKGGLTATDPFKGGVKGDKTPKGPLPTTDPFKDAGKGDKPKS